MKLQPLLIHSTVETRGERMLDTTVETTQSDQYKDWIDLNFQQIFNNKNKHMQSFDNSQIKIGKNIETNSCSMRHEKIFGIKSTKDTGL